MNSTKGSQPCKTGNFQSPIVPIVAPDVVIPIKCSQTSERIKRNQQLGALQSNSAEYGKQYKKDGLYSKTNNIRSKVKTNKCSFRPKYSKPFIPERVKDDERVVEYGKSYAGQSSQFFGGLPVPYRDKCLSNH